VASIISNNGDSSGAETGGQRGVRVNVANGGNVRRPFLRRKPQCPFSGAGAPDIHYTNIPLLSKYVSERGRILPMRITVVSAIKQRALSSAVKIARMLALMPFKGN
jgi:small subunit ribosomal protein S18